MGDLIYKEHLLDGLNNMLKMAKKALNDVPERSDYWKVVIETLEAVITFIEEAPTKEMMDAMLQTHYLMAKNMARDKELGKEVQDET